MPAFEKFLSGTPLIRRLSDHNPWWQDGSAAFDEDGPCPVQHHEDLRSDFYGFTHDLAQNRFKIVAGPAMVGKTTLLYNLIAASIDQEFRERHGPSRLENNLESLVGTLDASPRQFLYLPLSRDPLHQVQATEQLDAAISHFTNYTAEENDDLVLLLDDFQAIQRQTKRKTRESKKDGTSDQNFTPLGEFLHTVLSNERWSVAITTTNPIRTWQAVSGAVKDLSNSGTLDGVAYFDQWVEHIVHWKFRDFVEYRHPEVRDRSTDERFSSSTIRSELQTAIKNSEPESFVKKLVEHASYLRGDVSGQREKDLYTFLGGHLGLELADDRSIPLAVGHSDPSQKINAFLSSSETQEYFEDRRDEVLNRYRDYLYRQASNSEVHLADINDLERLLALISYLITETETPNPTEGISYSDLTDTFDIDRRTLRNKYFYLLDQFYLLSASEEYDNQRPKRVRVYPRDFGMVHAFTQTSYMDYSVPDQLPRFDKLAPFDHTVRLTYSLNKPYDPKQGRVKFWPNEDRGIDFVPRFHGKPIPIVVSNADGPEDLDPMGSTVAAFNNFFTTTHDSEQDPIADRKTTTLDDSEGEKGNTRYLNRRIEYVKSDEYAGDYAEESRSGAPVATDGDAPFGIVLTCGNSAPLSDQIALEERWTRKPLVILPIWLYLYLS